MTILLDDLIAETTVTTGTGTIDLDGAQTGYDRFRDHHADGDRVGYAVFVPGGDFERGIGRLTYGATDTITRDIVLVSSNGDTGLVDFAAGTKQVTGSFATATGAAVSGLGFVHAHRDGTNQSFTAGPSILINYTNEDADTEGWFDLSTDRYKPLVPGYYKFITRVAITDPTADTQIVNEIHKNGSLIARTLSHASLVGPLSAETTWVEWMNGSTDYVTHQMDAGGTGTKTIAGAKTDTAFQAFRVPGIM